MFGLHGAHRTGKTTLARALAERMEIQFVETPVSAVFARLGKSPKVEYPIEERLDIQDEILLALEATYESHAGKMWISDRTPLDLAMYTIADIQRTTLHEKPEVAKRIHDYVQSCLKSTAKFFRHVVLVQPGIQLIEAEGKAPACPAYMEHLNLLQYGLMSELLSMNVSGLVPRVAFMPRTIITLRLRIGWVSQQLQHDVNDYLRNR